MSKSRKEDVEDLFDMAVTNRLKMSMAGYTKLFNSILASTIWRAPNTTRIVWITMLAMADKDGVVEGSVPGLADFARVSVEDTRIALQELLSPDPDSRTGDYEGRRIETLDGTGWRLLNHGKYRAKMSEDERREYNRQKQAEWRGRKKSSNNVNDSQSQSSESAQEEADTEAHTKTEEEATSSPSLTSEREIVANWNAQEALQHVLRMSDGRRKTLRARLGDKWWREHAAQGIQRVGQTAFCRGQNERGWVATFDWFIQPDTLAKVMEGKYDDRTPVQRADAHQRRDNAVLNLPDRYA